MRFVDDNDCGSDSDDDVSSPKQPGGDPRSCCFNEERGGKPV